MRGRMPGTFIDLMTQPTYLFAPSTVDGQHLSARLSTRPTSLSVSIACALSALAVSTLPAMAVAQSSDNADTQVQDATRFEPVIVTATRIPSMVTHTIGDDSVITREDIARTPNDSFAQVLSRQHGISFYDRGGPQSVTGLNIRGTNTTQSLVMIDGMRVNSPTNGLPVLNAIPLNAIENIEIVRGAASSLYGANAIGGVVNIMTRQPAEDTVDAYVSAGVGSYGTSAYDAGVSGRKGMWTYSLYGGYAQSGGFQATNGDYAFADAPDSDSYYRSNVGGKLGLTWAPGQELSVQTLQSRINGGYDTTDPIYNDRNIQTLSNTIITSRNRLHEKWLSTLSVSFMNERNQNRAAPSMFTGTTEYDSSQTQYLWLNTIDLAKGHTLNLGLERLDQSVSGTDPWGSVNFDVSSIHTNAVMANYVGQIGNHRVQASVRNDDNSQYGNFTTGSFAYAWEFLPGWQASAAVSNAFRAPTFNELYYPGFSNPNLAPEKSRNYELGLSYRHATGEVALTAYYNRITDLIASEAPTYIPANIQIASIRGLSLRVEQDIGQHTTARASFDLLSPYNNSNGERLAFIAQRTLRLGVTHRQGDFSFNTDWTLTSDRNDGTTVLGGYGLLDLGIQYDLNKHTALQLQWNNVFNKKYTLVRGYNTQGSNVFFNVRFSL